MREFYQKFFFTSDRILIYLGTRVRNACLGLVYDKLLRLQNINGKQIGEVS